MNTEAQHPFFYTLGPGPYRFTKIKKGGACCSHCGTPIAFLCYVKIGDGKEHPVGSTCISKLSCHDNFENMSEFERAIIIQKRNSARESRERSRVKAIANCKAFIVENSEKLALVAHPSSYFSEMGKTGKDYAEWMINNSFSYASNKQLLKTLQGLIK